MAPAGPLLVLCEEKIRERSGLAPHRDLAELRSLSIPGIYQEKITHLGNSLMNLTGLKSLDLSRNSLVSLEGIQYLTALESLNLYYNCISSLADVLLLHSLTQLTDVDLRLNPVVKNESDYRLFVVHMLPKLRQLDDRPVRERERSAARLHLASEGSPDSKQSSPAVVGVGRPRRSRAVRAEPSAKKCLVMDADDEAVLNLIAECEWDLSNPPGSTGSGQRGREADRPGSQESRHLMSPQPIQYQCGGPAKRDHETRKSSSRGCAPEKRLQNQYGGEVPPQCGPHACFAPHPDCTDIEESSLSQKSSSSAQKVLNSLPAPEKYMKRRMPGGRFQAPADQECLSCLERPSVRLSPKESLGRQSGSEGRSERTFSRSAVSEPKEEGPQSVSGTGEAWPRSPRTDAAGCGASPREPVRSPRGWDPAATVRPQRAPPCAPQVSPKLYSAPPPGAKAALEVALLEALLDLVDRYWSGCKSLHGNQVFRVQAKHILSSLQDFTATQDSSAIVSEEISYLTLENRSLQKHLAEQQQQHHVKMSEAEAELSSTRKELDDLRQHLDKSREENSSLKALLCSMKKEVKNADTAATLNLQIAGLQTSVKRLSDEIVELKQHLEHYDRIQELTQMLQESHSSLVSTNEHLLQELSQVRAQHKAEVEQLHWSYQELKKTLGLFPQGSAGS